jgi:hypothetical protein
MPEIKVGRYRNIGYSVNYPMNNGMMKRYEWSGIKGDKVDIKSLPEEVVQWLLMNSCCFRDGDLKVIEDTPEAKEVVENIDEIDKYKSNTHSRDEVIKLLNGNYKKLEAELKKMNSDEKRFFADTAVEIKLDSATKQRLIADSLNIPVDILFEDEAESEEK